MKFDLKSKFATDPWGNKYCYNDKGQYHRDGGSAIEYINGDKRWTMNGEYHREDGPAVENADGYSMWYYHGKYIDCDSQEEFEKMIKLRMFW